ncbi:MAG TPA: glycosyltransferase family 39 protein, partial [Chloroflexota bacterium]|nr:glycosyltransferase family 39 protein [Chloroflexota bacterium]
MADVAARRRGLWPVLGGALVVLSGAHAYAQTLPWDQASPWVLASHLFAVVMLVGLLWLGTALGLRVVRVLGVSDALGLEVLLFAVGLGLGGLAYLVLACGFLGLLQPWVLAALLAVLAIVLRAELVELMAALPTLGRAWLAQRSELRREPVLRLTVPLAELLVALIAVRALAPPTAYDALMYHLEGPRQFLQLGRLAPLVEPHPANMPFTVQMLYLLGLAFGSDELPSLLHLSLAVLLGLTTFSFGRRFFGARVGWLAAAILLSAPTVAFYAPVANIDFGWAFFDFLAVYAFAIWTRDRRTHWLTLAGLAAGLTLGSKYLGLLTCSALALGIVV